MDPTVEGTHHHISRGYIELYLAELAWRQNNQHSKTKVLDVLSLLLSKPIKVFYEED